MKENQFEKEYQLWVNQAYEGWSVTEFDTLEECIKEPKYGNEWKISRKVLFEVKAVEQ